MERFSHIFADSAFRILSERHPNLVSSIRTMLANGMTPEKIAKQAEKICPKTSVVPGLMFGAAKFMLSQ